MTAQQLVHDVNYFYFINHHHIASRRRPVAVLHLKVPNNTVAVPGGNVFLY